MIEESGLTYDWSDGNNDRGELDELLEIVKKLSMFVFRKALQEYFYGKD